MRSDPDQFKEVLSHRHKIRPVFKDICQGTAENPPPPPRSVGETVPFKRIFPIAERGPFSVTFASPFHPPIGPLDNHPFRITVLASRRYLGAANPRIERIVGPLNRSFAHGIMISKY